VTTVKREDDNAFKCKCEKRFTHPDSLRRHAKGCKGKAMGLEKDGEEDIHMDEADSDVSESLEFNGGEINHVPIDCCGSRMSLESANRREC
jgi:hypothetical protein